MTQNTGVRTRLGRRALDLGLLHLELTLLDRACPDRLAQNKRHEEHDHALPDAEPEKRYFIAVARDHVGDRNDGDCRTSAEASGRRAGGKTAPVGKPLQRVADAGAIHRARAHAGDHGGGIQSDERTGVGIEIQASAIRTPPNITMTRRAVDIDEIGFDRNEPGLGSDEDREGGLDRGATPMIFGVDRIDKEGPAVLKVGDHRHADDAANQLDPARSGGCWRGLSIHVILGVSWWSALRRERLDASCVAIPRQGRSCYRYLVCQVDPEGNIFSEVSWNANPGSTA